MDSTPFRFRGDDALAYLEAPDMVVHVTGTQEAYFFTVSFHQALIIN